jgi:hypothetical protein
VKIWPFSKKTKKSDHFELPQGVVLAPADIEASLPIESHEHAEADYADHGETLLESSPSAQHVTLNEAHQAAALKEEAFASHQTLADFSNAHRSAPAMEIKAAVESSMHSTKPLSAPSPASSSPQSKAALSGSRSDSQNASDPDFVWSTDSSDYEDFIPPSDPSIFEVVVEKEAVDALEPAPASYELAAASLPDSHEPTDLEDWVSPAETTAPFSPTNSSDEDFLWPEQAAAILKSVPAVDEFLAPPDLRANQSDSDLSDSSMLPAPFKAEEADDWIEPSPLLAAAAYEALNTASANSNKVEPTDLLDYVDHSESLSDLYTHPTHTSETWLSDVLSESPPSSLASLPLVTPKQADPEHAKKNGKASKVKGFKEPIKEEEPKKKADKKATAAISKPSEPVPQPTKPQILPVKTAAETPKSSPQSHFSSQRQPSGASRIVPPGHLDRQNANPLAPYEDSLSDNLERFGKTVMHEDARFLKSSIDKLVEGYFSKQSTDEDF